MVCEITGFDEHPVISRNNLLPSESDLKKALQLYMKLKLKTNKTSLLFKNNTIMSYLIYT